MTDLNLNYEKNTNGDSLVNIVGVSGSTKFIVKPEVIAKISKEIKLKLHLYKTEDWSELEKFALLMLSESY